MSEQPSAAALVIATLVPALTDETCSQLSLKPPFLGIAADSWPVAVWWAG